jgi:hypothetical protein
MSNFTVRFFQEKVQMGFLSEQAGHPVFEDRDFIQINIPGDMSNIIEREATEIDRTQFASLFAAYKQGLEPSVDGMPVEQWAKLTKAQAANYKAQNFQTVEQIAEMSDHACGSVGMGATSDRAAAKDAGLAQKQAIEIDRQNTDIEELKRQVAELSALGLKANKTLGLPAKG